MSDDDILSSAKKFAAQFPGFLKACEMLGRIDSFERATKEAEAHVLAAQREEREVMAKHTKNLEAERRRILDVVERERQEARDTLDAAKNEAKRIKLAAQQEAENLARGIKEQAEKRAEEAGTELRTLQHQVIAVRSQLGDLQNSINERKTELNDITGKIRDATAKHATAARQLEQLRSSLSH